MRRLNNCMIEEVATVNAIFDYRTSYQVALKRCYPGIRFAVYDINGRHDRYLRQMIRVPRRQLMT